MGGDLGESTYGRRWVSEAVLVTVSSGSKIRFAPRPKQSLKAQWPDLQWGYRPPNRPLSLCGFADLAYSGLDRSFEQ